MFVLVRTSVPLSLQQRRFSLWPDGFSSGGVSAFRFDAVGPRGGVKDGVGVKGMLGSDFRPCSGSEVVNGLKKERAGRERGGLKVK